MTIFRQLAAVMFTDIEGYTALMQQNEAKAIQTRTKHRQVFNATTEKYKGRILQYFGDGTLSIFDSAIDAVKCGIEMQLGFREQPTIPVRIGIHTGDIMISKEEIIGDSVNIAARIESLSAPGSVFISAKVYDEIKNQDSIKTARLGPYKLKNVEKPVEVYAISNAGLFVPKNEDEGRMPATVPQSLSDKKEKPGSEIPTSGVPILATKLYIPPHRSNSILRPRLTTLMNEGLDRKLTLISAPPGFGKTTLVSEWISVAERPAAWLSMDEGDNDPTRFLTHLIAALQTIVENVGEGMTDIFQSLQPPPAETILTGLINEIANYSQKITLVLDDYHEIDAKSVHHAIGFLLEHLPLQMHVVITTREDPDLPLPKLRVRDQLTELRIADLRFTPAEAAGFLNKVMNLDLSAENVAALETRTEGWVAGLQLAALSMQGRKDISGFITSFAGDDKYITDYLIEEVLQRQSDHVRSFLLQTAILDRLNGSLCDALTGQKDGKKVLESLERGNLFVISLDDNRQWYRYHHLFGGVLLSRLMEEHADQVPQLHQQASLWYEQQDLLPDAIRHALSAKDFEYAADLIEQVWPKTDRHIQSAPWLGWAKALPETLVFNRPVLNTNYACALLDIGELEAGEVRLMQVEELLATNKVQSQQPESSQKMVIADKEQFQQLPATIAAARAYLAGALGDMQGVIKYTKLNIDLLPEDDRNRREGATSMLAIAYLAIGNLDEAFQTFERSFEAMRKSGDLNDVGGAFILADIRIAQGRLLDALNIYEEAFQLVPKQGPLPSGTAYLYLGLSKLYREQGNPTVANEYLLKSEEANKYAPYQLWQYRFKVAQAQVAVEQGNLDKAIDLLNKAEVLYYRNIVPEIRSLEALRSKIWIEQGKLSKAFHWVKVEGLSVDDELSYLREFEHLTLARLLIAQFKSEQDESYMLKAMGLLKRLLAAAEEGGRMGSVIEILIVEALANEAQKNLSRGLVPLQRALTLAKPEGYVRVFVNEGAPMRHLLTKAKAENIIPDYCDKLLALLEDEIPSRRTSN